MLTGRVWSRSEFGQQIHRKSYMDVDIQRHQLGIRQHIISQKSDAQPLLHHQAVGE